MQRLGEHIALVGEGGRKPVQRLDGGDDVVPLVVQCSHEGVEARDQITEGALVPGQRGREIVDDFPDLAQPPAVDDRAQRRQRLLGRRVGRRAAQRDGGAGLQPSAARLARRRVELHMHRAQQARLTDGGYHVGRHDDIALDRDLDVGMPALHPHRADTADHDVVDHHRRIRLHRPDIRQLDVIDVGPRPATDRTGQRQRIQAVETASLPSTPHNSRRRIPAVRAALRRDKWSDRCGGGRVDE